MHSQAYVSCIPDETVFTVTLPSRDTDSFAARASQANIAVHRIGLRGRFHCAANTDAVEALKGLCEHDDRFRLPRADVLAWPLRSNADAEIITQGYLHEHALESILGRRAHWFRTVEATLGGLETENPRIVLIGSEAFMPRRFIHRRDPQSHDRASATEDPSVVRQDAKNEIAVIGMACRFPSADSLEEFWELIESGKNALQSIPPSRFDMEAVPREPRSVTWGNFLRDPDAFDHRFFNISGREAKSMDPQQRLLLQVAYEALESAGYCSLPEEARPRDVGCYVGVGSVDYEQNVALENANAFSATGTLRAFICGRVSHFFGWTGPSMTFDTACSSSAVAIHSACKVGWQFFPLDQGDLVELVWEGEHITLTFNRPSKLETALLHLPVE